jgi:hypothetical protein
MRDCLQGFDSMKFAVCALLLCGPLAPLSADLPTSIQQEPEELVVYNRILAKVNGKTLSVIDVVKKMDLFLQKQYPEHFASKVARYQFYASRWKETLTQMIDTELMIADAERLEVKVSDAEVREEILNRFGPNIMPVLDKLALSYDEARTLIHDELLVQKMTWFRVHSKVLSRINSRDVKTAYNRYLEEHPATDEWRYQVLSIRAGETEAGKALAQVAFGLLEQHKALDVVVDALNTQGDGTLSISLSPEFCSENKDLSSSHKEVLERLAVDSYSQPIAQTSRADNSTVFRIFHLKGRTHKPAPAFEKLSEQIRNELLHQAADKENARYLKKLREQMGYDEKQMTEAIPDDFQPFALR